MTKNNLPIGFWVKQVDQLLTGKIDEIQAPFGLNRSKWQILNILSQHSILDKSELTKIMSPFLDEIVLNKQIEQLMFQGLIRIKNNTFSLTETGISRHAECLEKQIILRKEILQDILPENYEITVETLQKMAANIQRDAVLI